MAQLQEIVLQLVSFNTFEMVVVFSLVESLLYLQVWTEPPGAAPPGAAQRVT